MVVVVVVIIVAAGAGIILTAPAHKSSTMTSSSTTSVTTSSSAPFAIVYADLNVGYKGGLFQLAFTSTSGKPMEGAVAILSTPVQAVMCSGGTSGGLAFSSCLPGPGKSYTFSPGLGGSIAANATLSGEDTGAGPGSAVVGQSYPLTITAWFTDGTMANETFSVPAVSG